MTLPELRKDPVLNRWVLVAAPSSAVSNVCVACAAPAAESYPAVVAAPQVVLDRRRPVDRERVNDLMMSASGAGEHELIIETKDHGTPMSAFEADALKAVLATWRERFLFFRQDNRFRHMVIVKRQGPRSIAPDHACSEAFALPLVPPSVKEKIVGIQGQHKKNGACPYCELVKLERADKTRKIAESMRHIAIAPYASRVAFEVMILPKGHHFDFAQSSDDDLVDLAALLGETLERMEGVMPNLAFALFVQSAPPDMGSDLQSFHWHVEILPETPHAAAIDGVIDCCPLPPEEAARMLREVVR